ncbi:disease resistance protein Roq1 [Cryptomeria japonica]|uniref:disease resistance protein Roq1 n=1 Tax=Cryptomeria japonica TaxID=3369 RepID=UPI0027DA1F22|nr:disease resistance protein Roq1 [Cryptomeria japonica]
MEVAKYSVGLDELVEDFERQVALAEKQNIVGIFAMGGSGKTTLAKELFNRKRWSYHGSSFVYDVRETSARDELTCLQSQLLKDLFFEDRKFMSKSEGTSFLKQRIGRSSNQFLIVLDDVDDRQQLDALLFKDIVLKSGSLVIVTTRDESLLTGAGITSRYKLKEMKRDHAKELFCRHAFGLAKAPTRYEKLVNSFVDFCGGWPLAIQVSAANLFGTTDIGVWLSELQKFKSSLNLEIKTKLGISLGKLDREQKEIFMDIACFFIGKPVSMGVRIWKGSGWNAEHTIQTLKDKCLLQIRRRKPTCGSPCDDPLVFQMHDLLRDLGREMAREMDVHASPLRLWRPQDLKLLKNKGFKEILTETKDKKIRCFNSIFDPSIDCQITYFLGNSDDRDLALTDLLWIELQLNGHEWTSIPSWIALENLQSLRIIGGHLRRLWQKDGQVPSQLKELLLYRASSAEFPDEVGLLCNLEKLVQKGSLTSMLVVDGRALSKPLGKLCNLRSLVLVNCNLTGDLTLRRSRYPESKYTTAICSKLASEVLVSGESYPNLQYLVLNSVHNLGKLHLSLVNPLNSVKFKNCIRLKSVSGNLDQGMFEKLVISKCPQLKKLPRQLVSYLNSIGVDCSIPVKRNKDLRAREHLHLSNGKLKKYKTCVAKPSKSKTFESYPLLSYSSLPTITSELGVGYLPLVRYM